MDLPTISIRELINWKKDLHDKIIEVTSQQHETITTDKERIKSVFQEISKLKKTAKTIPNPIFVLKSEDISMVYEYKAKEAYKENELDESCDLFAKALAYAKPGGVQQGEIYGNRSILLYGQNLFNDALADINRAVSSCTFTRYAYMFYQKATSHQALAARKMELAQEWLPEADVDSKKRVNDLLKENVSYKLISHEICLKGEFMNIAPELKAENRDIPGLSNAVELKYSTEFGRHIVAARNIEAGEVIGVQKPFAVTVRRGLRYNICSHCQIQTWSSLPCNHCPDVVYCSEVCRTKAYQAYHDIECTVIPQILAFKIQDSAFLMGLRLTVLALKEANMSVEILKNKLEEIDASTDSVKKGFIDGKLQPDKFSSVHALASSFSPHLINYECASLASCIIVAYFLGEKIGLFDSSTERDLGRMQNNEKFIFLVKLIEKNTRVTIYNSYTMSMPVERKQSIKVSTALIPAFSFFNHHCKQMIVHSRHNDEIIIRSVCPIKKGEQIFDNYGVSFVTTEKKARHEQLKLYNFICKCEACVNDWVYDVSKIWLHDHLTELEINGLKERVDYNERLTKLQEGTSSATYSCLNRIPESCNGISQLARFISNSTKLYKANLHYRANFTRLLIEQISLSQTPFLFLDDIDLSDTD